MATLKQLIDKYDKEWTKYGMGSTISYSRVVTELKECALAEPSNENGALPIPDVSNCYAADCLIQDSCKSFKTERCNKECKLYA